MTKFLCSLLSVAFLFGATLARISAAADKERKKKRDPAAVFKKLDKDDNGSLSVDELVGKKDGEKAEKAKKVFARRDKNSDGSLSLEEFSAVGKKRKKKKGA